MNPLNEQRCTVERSASVANLAKSLAAAQSAMKNPPKESVNPHFKSRYADLATVRDAVLPALNRYQLSVLQLPCETANGPGLMTLLLHESGEWVSTTLALRPAKNDPQGIGSAMTYHRRYALQSIAGVAADDDDDGNAAGQPARGKRAMHDAATEAARNNAPQSTPPPAANEDTADEFGRLLSKAAEQMGLTAGEVFRRLAAGAGWSVDFFEDLPADQIARGCKTLRAKLAAKGGGQ